MPFWIEFFTDKRFGWRFKIANFIMGDYLRNYLAVGCLCELDNSINMEIDNPAAKYIQKRLDKVRETIIDIMEM